MTKPHTINPRDTGKTGGYTLLEISIVVALLASVFLMTGTVMIRGMQVVAMQDAYADISDALRFAAMSVTNEVCDAVLDNLPGNTSVKGLTIEGKEATQLNFQRPISLDGLKATGVISIAVRNEDLNGDLELDKGEDADKNGALDRVLERLEDLDGDGNYNSPGERKVLARDIDAVYFARDPGSRQINVTVVARSGIHAQGAVRLVEKKHSFTAFVRN